MTSDASQRVIPFVAVLVNERINEQDRSRFLADLPFEVRDTSPVVPFDHTNYYRDEMGDQLLRWWMSLSSLWTETDLPDRKRAFMSFEREAAEQFQVSERPFNLDPGYVKGNQVVLASTKYVAHRICIGEQMYAELTLMYEEGTFQSLPWTYPDYREPAAMSFFNKTRNRYIMEVENRDPEESVHE